MAAELPKPVFFSGLDLGQTKDPAALAVLQRTIVDDPDGKGRKVAHFGVVHLQRWPLGTGYPVIANDVVELFATPQLARSTLAIDQTGVGRPVVDMLREARPDAYLRPVTITSGNTASSNDRGEWSVPKKDLVGVVQALLGQRRLKVAEELAEAETLKKELANFQTKITASASEVFGAWREGQHDDLVVAVALAAWAGERNLIPSGWLAPTSARSGGYNPSDPMRGMMPGASRTRGFMGVSEPERRPW